MGDRSSLLVVLYAVGMGLLNVWSGIDALTGLDHAIAASMGMDPAVTAMGVLSVLLGGAMLVIALGLLGDRFWAYSWAVIVFGTSALVRFLTIFMFGNVLALTFIPIDVAVAHWAAKRAA